MTRQQIYDLALSKMKDHFSLCLELATGVGKSKMAIDLANVILKENKENQNILLLVAKRVHKQNWLDEINKWGGLYNNPHLTMECYSSLKKHAKQHFDIVIADEAHHLQSELRQSLFRTLRVRHKILFLSATFPLDFKKWLNMFYRPAWIRASLQDAISTNILPEPKILLLPLTLEDKVRSEHIIINKKSGKKPITGTYAFLWNYIKNKTYVDMVVTPKEKLLYYNIKVLNSKNHYMKSGQGKMQWMLACTQRLKYLSDAKNKTVLQILSLLKDNRTLTFCNSIAQTEVLGKYCIHSKEKHAGNILDDFNSGKINHITTCQMLNEGMNLADCQYGIFANINASKIITTQRFGRLLRHRHPFIIIPYFVKSREEELVALMIKGYKKSLITVCHSMDELSSLINKEN